MAMATRKTPSVNPKKIPLTLKTILLKDQNWLRFFEKYKSRMRPAIIDAVVKLLACKTGARGEFIYHCSNSACSHTKRVPFTCKHRLCSSCGKKATMQWIEKQSPNFPVVPYQHIIFTMPAEFRGLFWANRFLLNKIAAIAADCIKTITSTKGVTVGMFLAIHTFGGDLKRHVHIHLSVSLGGLNSTNTQWKALKKFYNNQLFPLWRARIIKLIRKCYNEGKLTLVDNLRHLQNDPAGFNRFLDVQYRRWWNVSCQPPDKNHQRNTEYFSRYVKRPAIANSRLQHYNGSRLFFRYYNHKSQQQEIKEMSTFDFIRAVIQHIPDKGFRLIRYYGFLANRCRGVCLPIIRRLLNLAEPIFAHGASTYAYLLQKTFNFDPLKCILCGSDMVLTGIRIGKTVAQLQHYHHQLALGKPVR
jgi:hypothetical protein